MSSNFAHTSEMDVMWPSEKLETGLVTVLLYYMTVTGLASRQASILADWPLYLFPCLKNGYSKCMTLFR